MSRVVLQAYDLPLIGSYLLQAKLCVSVEELNEDEREWSKLYTR